MYDATELLAKLSEAHGPSGYEGEVRKLIVAEASRHADRIEVDALGSVFRPRTRNSAQNVELLSNNS